jgi:hypothetical protein
MDKREEQFSKQLEERTVTKGGTTNDVRDLKLEKQYLCISVILS